MNFLVIDSVRHPRSVTATSILSPGFASVTVSTSSINNTFGDCVTSAVIRNPHGIISAKGWDKYALAMSFTCLNASSIILFSEKNISFLAKPFGKFLPSIRKVILIVPCPFRPQDSSASPLHTASIKSSVRNSSAIVRNLYLSSVPLSESRNINSPAIDGA